MQLYLRQTPPNTKAAEQSFQHACQLASQQRVLSWELRATLSLCRLWMSQDQVQTEQQRLSKIYDRFTEGFETPDLQQSRALLER